MEDQEKSEEKILGFHPVEGTRNRIHDIAKKRKCGGKYMSNIAREAMELGLQAIEQKEGLASPTA